MSFEKQLRITLIVIAVKFITSIPADALMLVFIIVMKILKGKIVDFFIDTSVLIWKKLSASSRDFCFVDSVWIKKIVLLLHNFIKINQSLCCFRNNYFCYWKYLYKCDLCNAYNRLVNIFNYKLKCKYYNLLINFK